jgi:uncharacterized damage-inducible protein DinB
MNELEQVLIGESAHTAPAAILEGLDEGLAHRVVEDVPHTIYQELWHIAFWQQISLEWIDGIETPFPVHAAAGFPAENDVAAEDWSQLRQRFLRAAQRAADIARDESMLERQIRCPSRPGSPVRTMRVREQLESMVAHNAYHLGRIVLLRQLAGAWPPPQGGFSW